METIDPDKAGERIDGVLVGGYEAEEAALLTALDDPVEPPFAWTEHEKVMATGAGVKFCWWCGSPITITGFMGTVHVGDGKLVVVNVMKRGCKNHIREVVDYLNEVKNSQ